MKYIVIQFKRGTPVKSRYYIDRTHRSALNRAINETWFYWDNALVVNEKLMGRRYVKDDRDRVKLNREIPTYFKTTYIDKPAVLVMFGRHTQMHKFGNIEERDSAYECMTSTPVAFVEKGKERTDTIALLDETLDSKSGSTSKKILSGYAIPVTWMGLLTHFNTAAPSGSVSARDSDEREWNFGWTPSPSKLTRTFATVKKVRDDGFVEAMKRKIGKTIEVKQMNNGWVDNDGWAYDEDWLDFDHVTLQVIQPEKRAENGMSFGRMHEKFIGKTMRMTPCNDHFTKDGLCMAKEWLVPASLGRKSVLRGKFIGGKSMPGLTFLRSMKKWVGKKCHFTLYAGELYKMVESGFIVHKNWIEFEGETQFAKYPFLSKKPIEFEKEITVNQNKFLVTESAVYELKKEIEYEELKKLKAKWFSYINESDPFIGGS